MAPVMAPMAPTMQAPMQMEAPMMAEPVADTANYGSRTACRGGGAGGMQNVGNSIGDVPSVKLHAPPGGSSSIAFGAEIDTNTAPTMDKSDSAARAFLSEVNYKHSTQGKLGVRDFHMLSSFPMFEQVVAEFQLSSLSYAEKVNVTSNVLKKLNFSFASAPACTPIAAPVMPAPAPVDMSYQPAPNDMMWGQGGATGTRTASRGTAGGTGGMQNVGNTLGDIPSVKLHAPPGGVSQIAFG